MAAKISQKPLKHVLPNFALMLFNLFPIKLHGDLTMFKSPFFGCPIKVLKKWEQKIFLISLADFYTFCIFSIRILMKVVFSTSDTQKIFKPLALVSFTLQP